MRFGPLFARGETLATRRNATDGTPPSGVAKNNPHQYTKALWQRMVAVLVAVSMATSLTPSAAFANENAEGTAADQPTFAASSDAVSGDADAGDSQVGTDHASGEQGADAAGDAGAAGDTSTVSGALVDEVPSGDSSNAEEVNSEAPVSVAAVSSDQGDVNAVAAASATTLSSKAKVFIQDSKDKDESYSTKSGALSADETLWANMYDEDDPDDYWSSVSSVANPGSWTYTWLAGTVKGSVNIADYSEVVGSSQSLMVTAAMAGKYLICKVTADGKDYYGPASSYDGSLNANYIPGPVLKEGQASLYSVKLDKASPSVGDTLNATAYTSYSTVAASNIDVTYTWERSASRYSGFTAIAGATGSSYTLTDADKDNYIKVTATAGVNSVTATTSDAVLAKGAVKLTGVQLSAPSTEIGQSLTAKPYTGSSYSPTYVGDDVAVTYTWKYYEGTSAPSSTSSSWEVIDGASGSTFAVDDEKYAGCFFMVEAVAGANTVRSSSVGPFKVQGQVDIYSASLADADTGESGLLFTADATVRARAKEKGVSTFIDSSKLNYQWQESDKQSSNDSDYVDIEGANGDTLALSAYEGKSVRCVVSSKVGKSSYATRGTQPIAAPGSVNVVSVVLDKTGKAYVGDTLTATAKSSGVDVSENERVTWQWYWGESGRVNACSNKIEGATSREFTVTDAYKGKYLVARADGGFGGTASSVVGPISVPGSVSLYGVTVSGSPKVGNALTAKATKGNSYTPLDDKDVVSYQWQVSADKSSYDSHFSNIEGATGAMLVLTDDLAGKYVRVVVASENSVKSTEKKSTYGGTSSVDPTGPITLAGQYELKSVGLENANVALTVGTQLTPKAQIPDPNYSWSSKDVPSDAKLTYTWYAKGNADADWTVIADGIDAKTGTLTLGDSLVGKRLKVTAYALDNTEEWISGCAVTAAGTYDLLRVTTTPSASNTATLIAGDTVSAMVQAKRADGSATTGVDVTKNVDIAWYAADSADGDYTAIEGLSGREAMLPESTAGKYLKVVATSGTSTIEAKFPNAVLSSTSLDALVAKLDKDFNPAPSLTSADENVNEAMSNFLAQKYGFDNVTVRVSAVDFTTVDANATVGISAEDDDTNGDITQFCMDPNLYTGYNWDGLRRAEVIFELSRPGENPVYYDTKKVVVPWDEGALQQLLNDAASGLDVTYAQGDSADSVTSNIEKMPYRAGSANKYVVKWTSSDTDALFVRGQGYNYESGDYTGVVSRKLSDRNVTLTATVSLLNGDASSAAIVGKKAFQVVVKADPEKIAAEKAALQTKVDAAFTYDNITDFVTGEVADKDGLACDLQMPRTKDIGIDGKNYEVKYTASTDDVTFSGYKGTVYQPLPGADAATSSITLTVTDKSNREIFASKTLDYKIAPQSQSDLDDELELMALAKASFAQGILDGQDQSAVTGNLHAPQMVYRVGEWAANWCYTSEETKGHLGIVPVELPGASETTYYKFKSSRPSIAKHENLLVTQPEYNTKVTISARLSSEKFARYAERYPDNADYAALANQDVSATVVVRGSTGLDDPNEGKTITTTAEVIGPDAQGKDATWVPKTEIQLPADEDVNAAELTKKVLERYGMTCDDGMWTISAKDGVLPNGQASLGSAQDSQGNWQWWVLYINGQYSHELATNYRVKAGDHISWYFSGGSSELPKGDVETNSDASHPNQDVQWGGFANGDAGSVTSGNTAVSSTDAAWAKSLLTDEERAAGASASASTPLIIGGKMYVVVGSTTYDSQTFAATQSLARLNVINTDTGSIEKSIALGSAMDTTCRPVYSDGIIVIPLSGGYLQAVSASTLETLWVSDAFANQNLSSLTVANGYVYLATVDAFDSSYSATAGTLRRVNVLTGAVSGVFSNQEAGYYWAGGVFVNGHYVIVDDRGNAKSFAEDLSSVVSDIRISESGSRSSLVVNGDFVYAVSKDGVLHRLKVDEGGNLTEVASVQFASSSTSTPTIANGYAFVGGSDGAEGVLAIIDLATMSVSKVTRANGEALRGDSKSTPLVSSRDGNTYVYFTLNGDIEGNYPSYTSGGGVYVYKLGDPEASKLYMPMGDRANYCMASVITDGNGNLYYTNDSGYLFCIGSQMQINPDGGNHPNNGGNGNHDSDDDSHNGSNDGTKGSSSGAVPPGSKPLSQASNNASDTSSDEKGASSDAKAKSSSKSASSESGAVTTSANDGDSVADNGVPVWAYILMAVGVAGLAAATVWFVVARRKRDGDE